MIYKYLEKPSQKYNLNQHLEIDNQHNLVNL